MLDETPMSPISAAEPPKADPLKPATPSTVKLNPVVRKPVSGATQASLRPGLKLPPKPGATVSALKPGLKLPPKPGATVSALRPGLKLPSKPLIRKPGASSAGPAPLPKPITGVPAPIASAAPAVPVASPAQKPVAIDAQGVGKLPTVEMKTIDRAEVAAAPIAAPTPMAALKSVTQKLKGITQQIPAQAILKKTGIIDDGAMSAAQKEAAKHKTARISLSDAMGVAPVKNEGAPMKTIHIKRPTDIAGATKPLAPQLKPDGAAEQAPAEESSPTSETSITQRKTLKISRPAGGVRPGGKFGIKRPGSTVSPVASAEGTASAVSEAVGDIPDIANIPDMSMAPAPLPSDDGGPAWLVLLSTVVQLAACVAIGALTYMLFENTQTVY